MLPRHWNKIIKLMDNGASINLKSFTFQQLLDEGIADTAEKVEKVLEISG